MQITSRPGGRIGRAGIKGRILPHHAGTAPINFWGGHMQIFFQPIPFAELLVESDIRHHIGLVPMHGSQPTFRHHALGRKVRHPSEILFPGQAADLLRLFIQIHSQKRKLLKPFGRTPVVRQENGIQFIRAAYPDDLMSFGQGMINKCRPRVGVAPDDQNLRKAHRRCLKRRWPTIMCRSSTACMS